VEFKLTVKTKMPQTRRNQTRRGTPHHNQLSDQEQRLACLNCDLRAEIVLHQQQAQAMLRRDAILNAVREMAEHFLTSSSWDAGIQPILKRLGQASETSRVSIFAIIDNSHENYTAVLQHEWTAFGIEPQMQIENSPSISWSQVGLTRWEELMRQGASVHTLVRELPASVQSIFRAAQVRTVAITPIQVGLRWWGWLCYQDCIAERPWTSAEIQALEMVARVIGVAIQRDQAEKELRLSEQYARNIIEASLDMIIATDNARRIVEFNPVAQAAFGYTRTEVIGKQIDFLYASPQAGQTAHRDAVSEDRGIHEIINRRKNGEYFRTLLSTAQMRDSNGNPIGIVGISRDMTDLKLGDNHSTKQ
jgi:PAS domain S-box-containing protein